MGMVGILRTLIITKEMEEEKETLTSFIDKVLRSDRDDELGPYVTSVLQQWRDEEARAPVPDPAVPVGKMDDEYSVAEGYPL